MLSLALSLTLASSSGGLLTEYTPKHVRLLDAPTVGHEHVLLAQHAASAQPPSGVSLAALKQEYNELQESMPGLGAPIGLLVTGGVLVVVVWWVILAIAAAVYSPALAVVGFVTLFVGIGAAIAGGVWLGVALGERGRKSRELRQLDAQIRTLESGAPLPTGPMLPPPPPPPMGQSLNAPDTSLALLSF